MIKKEILIFFRKVIIYFNFLTTFNKPRLAARFLASEYMYDLKELSCDTRLE